MATWRPNLVKIVLFLHSTPYSIYLPNRNKIQLVNRECRYDVSCHHSSNCRTYLCLLPSLSKFARISSSDTTVLFSMNSIWSILSYIILQLNQSKVTPLVVGILSPFTVLQHILTVQSTNQTQKIQTCGTFNSQHLFLWHFNIRFFYPGSLSEAINFPRIVNYIKILKK